MQIRRDLGATPSSPAEAWDFAQLLLGLYRRALPLYQGLDPKDKGPADDLIVLAAEAVLCYGPQLGPTPQEPSANGALSGTGAVYDQRDQVQAGQQQETEAANLPVSQHGQPGEQAAEHHQEQEPQLCQQPVPDAAADAAGAASTGDWRQQQRARQVALLRALLLLEVGQQKVTHTASLRLAATAVCGLLGAPQMAVEHFKMLDCKHIQTDTITSEHTWSGLASVAAWLCPCHCPPPQPMLSAPAVELHSTLYQLMRLGWRSAGTQPKPIALEQS